MRSSLAVLLIVALGSLAPAARAQDLPRLPAGMTIEQAVTLLQQNPQLQSMVRERLRASGLTREQIQQRLRERGYSPNLLDPYIAADAGNAAAQTDRQTVEALGLLGVNAFQSEPSDTARPAPESAAPREAATTSKGLAVFGLDVLRQTTTRFQPVAGPADDSYALGPGDVIVLILTGAVQTSHQLEVTSEGFVVIPQVGQVYVNGLTLGKLRDVLYDRLGQAYSGISRSPNARTQFDLTVAKVRVQAVRVVGEVGRPGTYQVAATGGVLSAIYEAGGLSERGNFRSVEVRRGDRLLATVDLYHYLQRGVITGEPSLQPGDVIFVPVHGPRIKVTGEVMRPAVYELRSGETLRDAIRLAGGLTPWAATDKATIDRLLPPDQRPSPGYIRTVLTANLREVTDSSVAPTALVAEDSVTVFRVSGGVRAAVTVAGAVWQPGTYRLENGMRLWDLVRAAGGLRSDTYEGRVQILRSFPDSTSRLLGFELDSASTGNNPPLLESDRVTVFAESDFRPLRYVTVFGAVRRPGTIAFADSMTLRDAILIAGGPRDDAYLGEAEISRLREQRTGNDDSLAVILRIPIDSSYVVDSTGYVRRPTGNGNGTAVPLHPYDNVFVRQQPGWELQRNVILTGEVRFPGRYTLTSKDERLANLINRAGGITARAYPRGLSITRVAGGTRALVAVDLPRALREPAGRENVILAMGDSLHVPAFSPTVLVDGAVNYPTTVTYVAGRGMGYYIDAAGGYSAQADKKRSFVRQPNGLVQRGGDPEPGATVTVPKRDPTERRWLIEMIPVFSAAIQALTAAVTIIIAAR